VAVALVGVGLGVRVAGEEVGGHFGGGFVGLACVWEFGGSGVLLRGCWQMCGEAGARLVSYRNPAGVAPSLLR
jgi:hypothetical protein